MLLPSDVQLVLRDVEGNAKVRCLPCSQSSDEQRPAVCALMRRRFGGSGVEALTSRDWPCVH
jgi:hypothetical protein